MTQPPRKKQPHKWPLKIAISIQKKQQQHQLFISTPTAPNHTYRIVIKLPNAWVKLIAQPKGGVHHLQYHRENGGATLGTGAP